MDIGRQSMYDTFGDKRALFLKALKMYVAQSVHSISVELERPGSALSAIQNALVTFAERKDLSSAEGCMGLNAITEFGRQDADVTRISRDAARVLRRALMHVLTRAKNQREISSDAGLDSMADFFESTLAGIRIAAKAGKSRRSLRNMAAFASRAYLGIGLPNSCRTTGKSETIDSSVGLVPTNALKVSDESVARSRLHRTNPAVEAG
jgi:TetR/AcrR family transcriptional regulator, transcriptional repressor for nem operon